MTRYTVRVHKITDDRASVTVTPADIYDFEEGKIEAVGRKIFTVQTEAENPVWAQQKASEYLSDYMR